MFKIMANDKKDNLDEYDVCYVAQNGFAMPVYFKKKKQNEKTE